MAAQMCKKRKVLPPIKHKLIWLQTERASRGTPALKLGSPERARDAIGFLDLSWRVEQQDARAQRAKSMKFKDGYMISSGQPVIEYIDSALRHVLLRQDVLGIEVKIVLDLDPNFPRVSNAPRHPYLIWSPFTNPRRKGT